MPTKAAKYIRATKVGIKNGHLNAINYHESKHLEIEPFNIDGSINSAYTNQSDSHENMFLNSRYVSGQEKVKIMTWSVHRAQVDFLSHPVTKNTIFVLTTVITAGMAQGLAGASRIASGMGEGGAQVMSNGLAACCNVLNR